MTLCCTCPTTRLEVENFPKTLSCWLQSDRSKIEHGTCRSSCVNQCVCVREKEKEGVKGERGREGGRDRMRVGEGERTGREGGTVERRE